MLFQIVSTLIMPALFGCGDEYRSGDQVVSGKSLVQSRIARVPDAEKYQGAIRLIRKKQRRGEVNETPPDNADGPESTKQMDRSQDMSFGFHVAPTFYFNEPPTAVEPHSVVVISLGSVRADHMAVYGGRATTRNAFFLAENGVTFDTAIGHIPETCPAHWTLMSGVLPEVHGNVEENGGSIYSGPTLAEIAQKKGFATAAFVGGAALSDEACGLARGFDSYDEGVGATDKNGWSSSGAVTQRAIDWISGQRQSFFAFIQLDDARFPYTPGSPWDKRYDPSYMGKLSGEWSSLAPVVAGRTELNAEDMNHVTALYDGEITQVDAALGNLLDAIPSDAVVVLTADHGESFEHGAPFQHKNLLWESVLRVPLIIKAEGLDKGKRIGSQVGLIDVAPTVLELAGLASDTRMHGQSMVELIEGKESYGRRQVFSVAKLWQKDVRFAVRTQWGKVIVSPQGSQAYDLEKDPSELEAMEVTATVETGAQDQYRRLVESLERHQVQAPEGVVTQRLPK